MTYTYLLLIAAWLVAFLFSIGHHLGRRWFVEKRQDASTALRPVWLVIALADWLFYAMLPGLALVLLYPVLPFSGFHCGLGLGLVGAVLGVIPTHVLWTLRQQQTITAALYDISFGVGKMIVCYGLIGAFYPP